MAWHEQKNMSVICFHVLSFLLTASILLLLIIGSGASETLIPFISFTFMYQRQAGFLSETFNLQRCDVDELALTKSQLREPLRRTFIFLFSLFFPHPNQLENKDREGSIPSFPINIKNEPLIQSCTLVKSTSDRARSHFLFCSINWEPIKEQKKSKQCFWARRTEETILRTIFFSICGQRMQQLHLLITN